MKLSNVCLEDQWNDESVLLCPSCGEDYLHHADTVVLNDENVGITFWCEHCGPRAGGKEDGDLIEESAHVTLKIEQHKGKTYVRWLPTTTVFPKKK